MRIPNNISLVLILIGMMWVISCAPSPDPNKTSAITGQQATLEPAVEGATPMPAIQTETPLPSGMATSQVTPTATEVQVIQQRLRDMNRDMVRIHQQWSQMDPQQRQQTMQLMADFMDQTSQLMTMLQQAMDQMTTEERQAAAETMQRIQANIGQMKQAMPGATPEATSTPEMAPIEPTTGTAEPGPVPDMGQMGREMGQMRNQMTANMQQMDPQQMQTMISDMADMVDNMDQSISQMGPAISRLSPAQREQIRLQVDRMYDTMQQMMLASGQGLSILTPTPESTAVGQ